MNKDKKLIELKSLVEGAEMSLQRARQLLVDIVGSHEEKILASQAKKEGGKTQSEEGQVVEGVFDGQNMVGPDEKKYSVPANYASKSKLVEGDSLKLTIAPDGSFIYKQINLLDRNRLVGRLVIDDKTNEYRVLANNKSYKVLAASITYFKGEPGDNVTILVPKDRQSTWAAVENIYKPGEEPEQEPEAEQEPKAVNKNKQPADEFLSQDKNQQADEEPRLAENKPPPAKTTEAKPEDKPQDIFEAAKKTDVDDVEQVNTEPPSSQMNQKQEEMDDLDSQKDNQGLEEL